MPIYYKSRSPAPKVLDSPPPSDTEEKGAPCIAFTIPLLVRVLELVREDVKSDVNLHKILEKVIELGMEDCLNMESYEEIATANPKR